MTPGAVCASDRGRFPATTSADRAPPPDVTGEPGSRRASSSAPAVSRAASVSGSLELRNSASPTILRRPASLNGCASAEMPRPAMDATVGSTAPATPPASAAPNCCAGLASLSRAPAGQAAPRRACNLRHRGRRQGLPMVPIAPLPPASTAPVPMLGIMLATLRPTSDRSRSPRVSGVGSPSASPTFGSNSDDDGAMGISVPAMALMPARSSCRGTSARHRPCPATADTLDCVAGAEAEAAREAFAQGWFRSLGAPMLLLRIGQHLVLRRAVRGGDDELAAIRGGDLEIRHQGAGRIDHRPLPLVGVASGSAGATSFHLPTPWMMS